MAWNVRIGINPISWSNDDLPALGGETPLETALREGAEIGYQGFELGNKFPQAPQALADKLAEFGVACVSGWYSGNLAEGPLDSEIETGHVTSFRRGTYFARDLPAGHVIEQGDLVLLRPEHGLPAWHSDAAIGRRLTTPVAHLDRVDLAALPDTRREATQTLAAHRSLGRLVNLGAWLDEQGAR